MGSQTVFLIFCGVLILVALFLAYQARKRLRLAKICELATEIDPGEAAHYSGQPIRVAGEAVPVGAEALMAPISQEACVYWKYEVLQRTRQGDKTFTRRIGAGESQQHFMLRDATGHIFIDPQSVQIRQIKKSAARTLLPGGEQLQGLVTNKHFGFALSRMYGNEWQIPLRATIYAVGTVVHHEDGSAYLVPGNAMAAVTMLPFKQFVARQRLWGFAMVGGAIACVLGGLYLLTQGF